MLDDEFVLKIADFGFAGPVAGRDGSGKMSSFVGTLNYMAPELHEKVDYEPQAIDLFSCAIILFIMVCGRPPFTQAQPNDPLYRCIVANRVDIFWKRQTKENGENFCSEEFKDLMNCMWQLDPIQRPTISEVLYHKWTQGPVPSEAAVVK